MGQAASRDGVHIIGEIQVETNCLLLGCHWEGWEHQISSWTNWPLRPLQLWGCVILSSGFSSSQCMAWQKSPSRKALCTYPVSLSEKLQKRTSGNRWMNWLLCSQKEPWPVWKPFECLPLKAEWALSSWKPQWNPAVGDLNLWVLCVNNPWKLGRENSLLSSSSSYKRRT